MRNIMISLGAAAAASVIAVPAAQAQGNAMLVAPQEQEGSGSAAPVQRPRTAAGRDRIVCMRVDTSASRITRRVCRTEQEWRDRGEFDDN